MKNKELDKVKPIYVHEDCYSTDDEINLLDLVLVLVRRKMLIGFILILSTIFGLFYSMTQTDTETTTYNYETSILIGHRTVNNHTEYLEPPSTLLSYIKHLYIPLFLSSSESENEYKVTAILPKNSGIIILRTSSTSPDDTNAIELLRSISNRAIADHDKYYESIKTSLNSTGDTENPANIALQLASLKKSFTTAKPRVIKVTSVTPGKSPKLILIISIFGGLFIAIFAAFFAEFISKVKQRMDEEKNNQA